MAQNVVLVKKYANRLPKDAINEKEVWRYSGYPGIPKKEEELQKLLETCIKETENKWQYRVCYLRCPIHFEEDMPVLPFPAKSKDLAKCLKGCEEVILFAATVGIEIDRLIARYQSISPAKALLFQALGAERIENLCDVFCEEMRAELAPDGYVLTPRFSPGYGDLPLSVQKDFFRLLDCSRHIGVSLQDSLLMTPSKSVTAIMGIRNRDLL